MSACFEVNPYLCVQSLVFGNGSGILYRTYAFAMVFCVAAALVTTVHARGGVGVRIVWARTYFGNNRSCLEDDGSHTLCLA